MRAYSSEGPRLVLCLPRTMAGVDLALPVVENLCVLYLSVVWTKWEEAYTMYNSNHVTIRQRRFMLGRVCVSRVTAMLLSTNRPNESVIFDTAAISPSDPATDNGALLGAAGEENLQAQQKTRPTSRLPTGNYCGAWF